MESDALENFEKARKIYEDVEKFAIPLVKKDTKILDLAENIENKIKELGGKPAFPVNIGINDIAAHYTPDIDDKIVIKVDDLVKVDFGVHVNGWIYDGAFSVSIGEKTNPLIKAAEDAVNEAAEIVKPGTKIKDISEVIENSVKEFGFNVVRNLCGHGLEKFDIHSEPTIPNIKNNIETELKEGQIIAIEVFTTKGSGWVKDSRPFLIFQYLQDKPVRNWEARKILEISKKDFEKLPFTKRWVKDVSSTKFDMMMNQLLEIEALQAHPILKEESGEEVAQFEKSILIR